MKLLVSVCSADEARSALAGGADLIDITEPARGSLGRADDEVMLAVAAEVNGRAPISVALGELKDSTALKLPRCKCDFVKFGLSDCRGFDWQERLRERRRATSAIVVPAAYADFLMANAPDVDEVVRFAIEDHFPVLLIDTFGKEGRSLFDWMSEAQLRRLSEKLRAKKIDLALAGSLSEGHLPQVKAINPTWLAVRGAVCHEGNRAGEIDGERVRRLKGLVSI